MIRLESDERGLCSSRMGRSFFFCKRLEVVSPPGRRNEANTSARSSTIPALSARLSTVWSNIGHTTMSEKGREEFREMHYRFDLRVFPDALRGEAQKEFPGEEFVKAMRHYVDKHPELVLQPFPL
jgi:hypothetical protein